MSFAGDVRFFLSLVRRPGDRRDARRWWRMRYEDAPMRFEIPWLPLPAIDVLEALDRRGARVFEYGSGGSTLYWLRRGASVVSVEHDERWFAALAPRVRAADYRLVLPEAGTASADPADPAAYASSDPASESRTFRAYAQSIDAFPDGTFDIVLVDGRARPSCIVHAAPKVKPHGLLIVDNADREHYFARTKEALREFAMRVVAGATPGSPARTPAALLTRQSAAAPRQR